MSAFPFYDFICCLSVPALHHPLIIETIDDIIVVQEKILRKRILSSVFYFRVLGLVLFFLCNSTFLSKCLLFFADCENLTCYHFSQQVNQMQANRLKSFYASDPRVRREASPSFVCNYRLIKSTATYPISIWRNILCPTRGRRVVEKRR